VPAALPRRAGIRLAAPQGRRRARRAPASRSKALASESSVRGGRARNPLARGEATQTPRLVFRDRFRINTGNLADTVEQISSQMKRGVNRSILDTPGRIAAAVARVFQSRPLPETNPVGPQEKVRPVRHASGGIAVTHRA
jgi:hypothetical protein